MATAKATVSINAYPNGKDTTRRHEILFGTIAIQASPATYAAGGLAVSFSGPSLQTQSQTPLWVDVKSKTGSGYIYSFNEATGKVQILESPAVASTPATAAPLAELTDASAIPAGVSADTIEFRAEFAR